MALTRYKTEFRPEQGQHAVRLMTRTMSFTGYVKSINGAVIVLDHPRGGEIVVPIVSVLKALPLPAGAKI